MNEGTKTGIFWAVAVVMAGFATFVAWPNPTEDAVGVRVGKPLFEDFKDPLAAANLKIVTFDETLGQLDSFEVAKNRQTGVWSIPSRQGYPADATEQMQKAATALLGLKILDVKTDKAEEHAEYGVLEPDADQLRVGDEGVGRLVTVQNEEGNALAQLIIGDKVKGTESHRYVRVPNQDPVYEVELDDTPLTTKFRQWIEDDLLQLASFDIAGAKIHNYTVAVGGNAGGGIAVNQKRNYDANLTLSDSNEWELENLVVFDAQNTGTVKSLGPDESLNTEKLNAFKNALDDLKIVDVVRKPEGMSSNLKAEKSLFENDDSLRSLATRGFYPVQGGSEGLDILAANGEVVVGLKNGVEYVLRFGGIAGIEEAETEDGEADAGEQADTGGANRYLLVTTRVNESQIPPPELKVVPQTLEELEAMQNPSPTATEADAATPAEPADAAETDSAEPTDPAVPAQGTAENAENAEMEPIANGDVSEVEAPEEPATEEPAPEEVDSDASASDDSAAGPRVSGEVLVAYQAADEETPATDEPATDEPATDEPATDEPATTETATGEPANNAAPAIGAPQNAPAEPELTAEEQQERLEAEQEKILKENQRLRDAWKEKLDEANRRVRELNSRFADWYYIVPESTYADLQIKLDELILRGGETPAAPAPGTDPAAGPGFPFNFGGGN